MNNIWEGDDDVISKILSNDVSANGKTDDQAKSLHQEFMEVGEKYELSTKREFSLENLLHEFQKLNSVVEEKLKGDESCCVSKEEARGHTAKQKAVKPPPGFPPKTNSIADVNTKPKVKPPPGFPPKVNTAAAKLKSKVGPPPGFPLKVNTAAAKLKSKVGPPPGFPLKVNTAAAKLKSKVGPPPGFPPMKVNAMTDVKKPSAQHPPLGFPTKQQQTNNTCLTTKPRQKLGVMMEDFHSLSTIMDQELSTYENKLLTARDQMGSITDNLKEQGKVEMLKTLFYEQQEKMKTIEKQNEQHMIQAEANHKKEKEQMRKHTESQLNRIAQKNHDQKLKVEFNKALKSREAEIENLNAMVSDLQNELDKQVVAKPNKKLQFEFNRALNDREEEIDRLNAVIHDMQCELEQYEGGSDDIAMEVRH